MMKFIVAFTDILYAFYKRVYFSLHKRILKAKGLDFGISFDIHWGVDFWGKLQNMHFGTGVSVWEYTLFTTNGNGELYIRDNVHIGRCSQITATFRVELCKNVTLGPNIFITDSSHEYRDVTRPINVQGCTEDYITVTIGEDSWLGANVNVIGNVKIGKHCVIGAGSVVTKDIPDFSVACGNPCRVIKRFGFEQNKWIKVK